MSDKEFNDFSSFWTPIYKQAYFKARLLNQGDVIYELKLNIYSNWNLSQEQKNIIWETIIGGKYEYNNK